MDRVLDGEQRLVLLALIQQIQDRRAGHQSPLHPCGAALVVERGQQRDTSGSKMTHVAHVEHYGAVREDEPPDVLAGAVDIDGVDLASDGHHCRQVTTVRPNLGATALEDVVALSGGGGRNSHEQPLGDGGRLDADPPVLNGAREI